MLARTEIDAGVCGFHTTVTGSSDDGMMVSLDVVSECEKVRTFAATLVGNMPLNAYEEISPAGESVLLCAARTTLKGCCAGCVVPPGVFKTMQVAAGLALPKDISLRIEKG